MAVGCANNLLCLPISTGTADGAQASPPILAMTWRPGWLICIQTCAPFWRADLAQAVKGASGVLASRATPPGPVIARLSIMTLPVIIRPTPPCAQLWYKRYNAGPGTWPTSAMFSSIAAFARRLGRTLPLGRVSGVNIMADP
ncbi:hypothetical protein D3C78_1322530 [compost metagenome]